MHICCCSSHLQQHSCCPAPHGAHRRSSSTALQNCKEKCGQKVTRKVCTVQPSSSSSFSPEQLVGSCGSDPALPFIGFKCGLNCKLDSYKVAIRTHGGATGLHDRGWGIGLANLSRQHAGQCVEQMQPWLTVMDVFTPRSCPILAWSLVS